VCERVSEAQLTVEMTDGQVSRLGSTGEGLPRESMTRDEVWPNIQEFGVEVGSTRASRFFR